MEDDDSESDDSDFDPGLKLFKITVADLAGLDKADPEAKEGGDEEFDSDAADRSTDSEDRGTSVSIFPSEARLDFLFRMTSPKMRNRKRKRRRKRSLGKRKRLKRAAKRRLAKRFETDPKQSSTVFLEKQRWPEASYVGVLFLH